MVEAINEALRRLCANLNGPRSGNYVAEIQVFHGAGVGGRSVVDAVCAALDAPVVVASSQPADCVTVISSLKSALEYAGDYGSHPDKTFLASEQFRTQEGEIVRLFEDFLSDAGRVMSFSLKDGHPFYPVFWDFAFLIDKGSDAFVVIGSSSD